MEVLSTSFWLYKKLFNATLKINMDYQSNQRARVTSCFKKLIGCKYNMNKNIEKYL